MWQMENGLAYCRRRSKEVFSLEENISAELILDEKQVDRLQWIPSNNGTFSVTSALKALVQPEERVE